MVITIVQRMELPFGRGTCNDQSSSLLRPFRRLAEQGKPTGHINYLFLKLMERYYVIGSLCYTPRKMLLFFPGLLNRRPVWQGQGKQIEFQGSASDTFLDHLTLESDQSHWHPRYLEAGGKKARFPPSEGNYRRRFATYRDGTYVFWFSMAVREPNVLEEAPRALEMKFTVPDGDVDRRISDLVYAREEAQFHILQLNPTIPYNLDYFLFLVLY